MTPQTSNENIRGIRTFSKKKCHEIIEQLRQVYTQNDVDRIITIIKDVLKFDPQYSGVYS